VTSVGIMASAMVTTGPGLGEAASMTSSATITITTIAPIAIGDLVIVYVASDNLGTTTPTFTCADSGGNSYTTRGQTSGGSTAGTQCAVGLMASKATVAVATGGTITVTLSGAVTAKAVYAEKFTGFQNVLRVAAVVGSSSVGDPVQVTSTSVSAGDLAIGACAIETRFVPAAATSPNTNGTWSSVYAVASDTTAANSTCVSINRQYKVTTGAGTQQIIFSSSGSGTPDSSALAICVFTP